MTWWEMFLAGADADHSGSVDLAEFSALWARMESSPDPIAEAARTVFNILDADGDGIISVDEYRAFLRSTPSTTPAPPNISHASTPTVTDRSRERSSRC